MLKIETDHGTIKVESNGVKHLPADMTGTQHAKIKSSLKGMLVPKSGTIYVDKKCTLPYMRIDGKIAPLSLAPNTFTRNEESIH